MPLGAGSEELRQVPLRNWSALSALTGSDPMSDPQLMWVTSLSAPGSASAP